MTKKAEKQAARELDLDARAPAALQHGHVVTGRTPAECPCGGHTGDTEVHRIEGTDEQLADRARAVGWPVDAYVRGIRLAEANAARLAAEKAPVAVLEAADDDDTEELL